MSADTLTDQSVKVDTSQADTVNVNSSAAQHGSPARYRDLYDHIKSQPECRPLEYWLTLSARDIELIGQVNHIAQTSASFASEISCRSLYAYCLTNELIHPDKIDTEHSRAVERYRTLHSTIEIYKSGLTEEYFMSLAADTLELINRFNHTRHRFPKPLTARSLHDLLSSGGCIRHPNQIRAPSVHGKLSTTGRFERIECYLALYPALSKLAKEQMLDHFLLMSKQKLRAIGWAHSVPHMYTVGDTNRVMSERLAQYFETSELLPPDAITSSLTAPVNSQKKQKRVAKQAGPQVKVLSSSDSTVRHHHRFSLTSHKVTRYSALFAELTSSSCSDTQWSERLESIVLPDLRVILSVNRIPNSARVAKPVVIQNILTFLQNNSFVHPDKLDISQLDDSDALGIQLAANRSDEGAAEARVKLTSTFGADVASNTNDISHDGISQDFGETVLDDASSPSDTDDLSHAEISQDKSTSEQSRDVVDLSQDISTVQRPHEPAEISQDTSVIEKSREAAIFKNVGGRPKTLSAHRIAVYRNCHGDLMCQASEWNEQLLLSKFSRDELEVVALVNQIPGVHGRLPTETMAQIVLEFLQSNPLKQPDDLSAVKPTSALSGEGSDSGKTVSNDINVALDSEDLSQAHVLQDTSVIEKSPVLKNAGGRPKTLNADRRAVYRKCHEDLTYHASEWTEQLLLSKFTRDELEVISLVNRIPGFHGRLPVEIMAQIVLEFLQSNSLQPSVALPGGRRRSSTQATKARILPVVAPVITELSADTRSVQQPKSRKRPARPQMDDTRTLEHRNDLESHSVRLARYRKIYSKIIALDWPYLTQDRLSSTVSEAEAHTVAGIHLFDDASLSKPQLISLLFGLIEDNTLLRPDE